jgi:spore coat polysaccharide biosynthesis protein SpsF (cytidylyltransferase family)/sialic acid synthase SpsE
MKVIAESAFNHNGDVNYLLESYQAAYKSGADYFTVQIYSLDDFCVKDYDRYVTCKECELSKEDWVKIFEYARDLGKTPIIPCTLDIPSFEFCYQWGYRLVKIHATDILNKDLLEFIASKGDCKVLLETQCAGMLEIDFAVGILGDCIEAILHGFSNYPTEHEDLNLNAIDHIKQEWGFSVGLADHTLDTIGIPLMAMAKGCEYFEKHITPSRNDRNYDWQVSLEVEDFSTMVNNIRKYEKSLGSTSKHPGENEKSFRNVLYKKHLDGKEFIRSNDGLDYLTRKVELLDKDRAVVAVIARLKSKRLKRKVLKPIGDYPMIISLMDRIRISEVVDVILATSDLEEDAELVQAVSSHGFSVNPGHPDSVISRLINIALHNDAGYVFRVTGDNPLTDPGTMEIMLDMARRDGLDYVRCNKLPMGISAELFSSKYLLKLYYKMDNPLHSEYLTWDVMNDKESRKGCINYNGKEDLSRVRLTVDYQKDYDSVVDLINKIGKPTGDITLQDIEENVDMSDLSSRDEIVKLPGGKSLSYGDYLDFLSSLNYISIKNFYDTPSA